MKVKSLTVVNLLALACLGYLSKNVLDRSSSFSAEQPVIYMSKITSSAAQAKDSIDPTFESVSAIEETLDSTKTELANAERKKAQLESAKESAESELAELIESNATAQSSVRVLLVPEKETTIASTLASRIVRLDGILGKSFRAGQPLVTFDCEEAHARTSMSKAELASAIDQHEAKVKMQGLEQASHVEVSMAASDANRAKAQLDLHRAQASQCKIYAPWSGRIAKLHAKNHMTVAVGEPLMDLVKNGPLKLKVNVPSKSLSAIQAGTKFVVSIDETGKTYDAAVTAINSRVDPVSQTVEIEAKLAKVHQELLPGMSGVSYLTSFN